MSIRKREWKSPDGEAKEAWVVNYTDAGGKRRLRTFARKRDADAYNTKTAAELRDGTHVADRASITVAEAGKLWLAACERQTESKLERSSIRRNTRNVHRHINPRIAAHRSAGVRA
jgi:hypothetical protein